MVNINQIKLNQQNDIHVCDLPITPTIYKILKVIFFRSSECKTEHNKATRLHICKTLASHMIEMTILTQIFVKYFKIKIPIYVDHIGFPRL